MANEKFYVVTQGEYSDYHIVGVTADRDIAEKIAAKFTTQYDECRIEEYGDGEVMLKPAWIVYFDRSGNIDSTPACDCAYDYSRIGEVYENKFLYGNYHIKDENMKDAGYKNLDNIREFEELFLKEGYNTRIFDPAGQDDIGGGCGQLWYVQQWMKNHIKGE